MQSDLYDQYVKDIRPKLQKDLGIKNPMQVPCVQKININVGIGSYLQRLGSKDTSFVEENITNIAGQKPVIRKAKLSVSNFKLRKGMPVGFTVTLRSQAAYNFLYKLIHIVYPRVRDFRGVPRNIFDKHGNCSFGFTDHTVFPEGKMPEDTRKIHGLQVTVVTNTKNPEHSLKLMEAFGFPFKKQPTAQAEQTESTSK